MTASLFRRFCVSALVAGLLCTAERGLQAQQGVTLPGGGTARLSRASSRNGQQYYAEWSADLALWSRLPQILAGTGGTLSWDDSISGVQRRFYRTTEMGAIPFPLNGLNFSPYLDGQNPNLGTQIPRSQIEARMRLLIGQTNWVRTFSMVDGMQACGSVARQLGFQVALGAWLGPEGTTAGQQANQANIAALIAAGQAGEADLLIVGSEVLQRGDLPAQTLVDYINQVKTAVPGVWVTTADTYIMLADTTVLNASNQPVTVMEACDLPVVMANFYPFWEKIAVGDALVNLSRAYTEVSRKAGGRPVWISEMGWPSAGTAQGPAAPTPANAAQHLNETVSWARLKQIPFFYFDAFDEAWKATTNEGDVGAHWGLRDTTGAAKPGMADILGSQSLLPAGWNDPVGGSGTPSISFTFVPPLGSDTGVSANQYVTGVASHVAPFDAYVVIYIKVAGNWWIKPYATRHLAAITQSGVWSAQYYSYFTDANATDIAAFLIPATYIPPVVGNAATLPAELYTNSLANALYTR